MPSKLRLVPRLGLYLLFASLGACNSKPAPVSVGAPSALEVADLKVGDGPAIAAGQTAVVNYTGWLFEFTAPDHKGTQFDSSLSGGSPKPFRFKLGAGEVIPGWDRGIAGMHVGGRRRLTIPPGAAYGDSGAGRVIPPGATLVFDVELLAVELPPTP